MENGILEEVVYNPVSKLLTLTMIEKELENNKDSLYKKRLLELPDDINEFSQSLETYKLITIDAYTKSIKDIVNESKNVEHLQEKIKKIRLEEKILDERFNNFTSNFVDFQTQKNFITDSIDNVYDETYLNLLRTKLKESYTYLLSDTSKLGEKTSYELIEEINNLEMYLNKTWTIRTKFNDAKYITNNTCTLLENSYTSNKDLKYMNRTRRIGEILQLIQSSWLKKLSKDQRPQLYNTILGNRPSNTEYRFWNGMQVFDLDLKNSPNFNDIKDFNKLKHEIFDRLKHYNWLISVSFSSSGKGIHIYTKVTKPHLITLSEELNERLSCFWFRMSYLQKYAIILNVLKTIGIKESDDPKHKVIDFALAKISHGIKVAYDKDILINPYFEDIQPMIGFHNGPCEINDWLFIDEVQNAKTFHNWITEFENWVKGKSSTTLISSDFIIDNESVKNVRPYDGDVFYQLRYHVCNTIASLFGESGRQMAHYILRSKDCRNEREIDGMFNCSVTSSKQATKYGISILKKCGLKIELPAETAELVEEDFKEEVKTLISKAVNTKTALNANYTIHLESNEYLGMFKDDILANIKGGYANLLVSPPGTGKTEFIKALAKNKRVLLVLPYISVIDSKIINDEGIKELFDIYQGSTSVDGIRKGRSAVMTIDKFSNLSPEKIAYLFDIIAIDESHLIFTSSFRLEAMSNALKNIKEFIGISQFDDYAAKILCMTGTPTGEPIYFDYYGVLNTIHVTKTENRSKSLNFVLCKDDDAKLANIAFHISKSLKDGKKVLYPTNAGDVQAIKLIGMIEYELKRKVKWGYYKKANANSQMSISINENATVGDYELVLASNYLSVGIDINDFVDFECVYDDSFSAFEIEQFNCRLRKVDINSTIYIGLNDNGGDAKGWLLNISNFSIKMNREDRDLVRDFVDISNKKMELSMVYDPITNRIFTPGFRVENGQIVFKLEEHELTLFEERYLDTVRAPFFIAKEMAGYGYEIHIQEDNKLVQDHINNLIEIGLENAKIESEIRNEKVIKTTEWMFDNSEYNTSIGGKIDDLITRIWKENIPVVEDTSITEPEVVETFLGDIEHIKVPNSRIFEEQLKVASRLLSVYSPDTSKFLFESCISDNGKLNKSEVSRYLKLIQIIKSEDRGSLGEEIKDCISEIHNTITEMQNNPDYRLDSIGYEEFIDRLTGRYLNKLQLNLRTSKMIEKYRTEISELVNTLCSKNRKDKAIMLNFRIIPTPDGKYVSKIEEYDATIIQIFQLSDSQLPNEIKRKIRMHHIEDEMKAAADNVQEWIADKEKVKNEILDEIEIG